MRNFFITLSAVLAIYCSTTCQAIVTSKASVSDNLVSDGSDNGVVQVYVNYSNGSFTSASGALLAQGGGQYVITSAHLLTNNLGQIDIMSSSVRFQRDNVVSSHNFFFANTESIFVSPLWDGTYRSGADLAIVKLQNKAPPDIPRYELGNSPILPVVANFVGWGNYGLSGLGEINNTTGYFRLSGTNRIDSRWGQDLGRAYALDFDNGEHANDAFGFFLPSLSDIGTENEVMIASGDSGSPIFVNNKIVGIVTFSGRYVETDIDSSLNSSFGEFGGGISLEEHMGWIQSVTGPVPEPSEWLMFLLGITMICFRVMRKSRRSGGFFFIFLASKLETKSHLLYYAYQ